MRRRDVLKFTASAGATGLCGITAPNIGRAQSWPDRPVRFIVPFAAGGATDLLARPWTELLGKAFNQQFVIENRGGASGLIGAEAGFKAAPDGYTFLFAGNTATVTLPLLRKVNYEAKKFMAVARMGDAIAGFVVHPSVGVKTFPEMVDYAKKHPGRLTFGSSGVGTSPHLRYEMLRLRTGVDILHVPYRGGSDSLQDLLAGNIHLMNEGSTLPQVRAGKIILLNLNHRERVAEFPNVPTLTELGIKDADCPTWFTLWAPPGTPYEICERINAKVNEFAATPEMKARMQTVSAVPVVQTIPQINAYWENDYTRMAALIKEANIKIE